jgi:hypothetical protein
VHTSIVAATGPNTALEMKRPGGAGPREGGADPQRC